MQDIKIFLERKTNLIQEKKIEILDQSRQTLFWHTTHFSWELNRNINLKLDASFMQLNIVLETFIE